MSSCTSNGLKKFLGSRILNINRKISKSNK